MSSAKTHAPILQEAVATHALPALKNHEPPLRSARVVSGSLVKDNRPNILFLCMRNSCRSQMAEGWMRRLGRVHLRSYSAGIEPQSLNTFAVRVMEEAGIDISAHYAKSVTSLSHIHFHFVIAVCDEAADQCPVFPGKTQVIRATFRDPLSQIRRGLRKSEVMDEYRRTRDQVRDYVMSYVSSLRENEASLGRQMVHRG